MWALQWSCGDLLVTGGFQLVVVAFSGSVALLADTLHNFGDAATALLLWVAFILARQTPTERFTYGLGGLEDLASLMIVLIMALSALVAGAGLASEFHAGELSHHCRSHNPVVSPQASAASGGSSR
jgi:divalent metal cation (Fe/Co/Zn/Cd) transporter